MTRTPYIDFDIFGGSLGAVTPLVLDPGAHTAALRQVAAVPDAGSSSASSASSSSTGGWSVQSYSFSDGGGASSRWTVIGGRPGQDPRLDLGPVTHPGTPGNDVVLGGPGDDTIAGGLGDDTLGGGAGADTFLYVVGDGNDTIADWERGADRLVILGAGEVSLTSSGGTAVVTLSDGSQITLLSAAPPANLDVAPLG